MIWRFAASLVPIRPSNGVMGDS